MAYTWTSKTDPTKTGYTLTVADLSPEGKKAYETCRATYKANKEAKDALAAVISKAAGIALTVNFNFKGDMNVSPAKAKVAKASAQTTVTLADWLKTQNA